MASNRGQKPSRGYCSYFDSGYLSRGLTLIDSLRANGDNSPVYVLALDDGVADYFARFPREGVHVIRVAALEAVEPGLLSLKKQRTRMEYYFTCTPLLIRYVLNQLDTPGSVAIYLDADMYFFDDPTLVVDALGTDSVGIIEHRYPDRVAEKLAKYGRFNVGWVGFRDDQRGRAVLDWYASKCLEWCSDTPSEGRYADQGYLNWFPEFPGVRILPEAGFNLAPWNTKRHAIAVTRDSKNQTYSVQVDAHPLVFFHAHGVRKVGHRYITAQLVYGASASRTLMREIYRPYIAHLESNERLLHRQQVTTTRVAPRGVGLRGVLARLRKFALNALSTLTGNSVRV